MVYCFIVRERKYKEYPWDQTQVIALTLSVPSHQLVHLLLWPHNYPVTRKHTDTWAYSTLLKGDDVITLHIPCQPLILSTDLGHICCLFSFHQFAGTKWRKDCNEKERGKERKGEKERQTEQHRERTIERERQTTEKERRADSQKKKNYRKD